MEFKSGAKVVHKTHGVGIIQGIEALNFNGNEQDYYLLKIVSSGLMVRFPKTGKTSIVRSLATEQEIAEIFETLRGDGIEYSMSWNKRRKEFERKIQSGSLVEISEVLRDLSLLRHKKELSYGEKDILEAARSRILNEISAAKATSSNQVAEEIEKALER